MTNKTNQLEAPTNVQQRAHLDGVDKTTAGVNYNIKSDRAPKILIETEDEKGQRIIHPEYTNIEVELYDASQVAHAPNFADSGLQFCNYPTNVSAFDKAQLNDDNFRQTYDAEIRRLIIDVCEAKDAFVFDHTIRDDRSTTRSPAKHVHSDYSDDSARTRLHDFLGEENANAWEADGFAIVNIWRPIGHPVEQSPLCFIDARSVTESDWVTVDLIYPDRQGQVMGMYHNPAHKWLYLPEMTPDEVAIFSVADSTDKPIVAHSAADLVNTPENARPRRSIETRVLVRW